MAADSFDTEDYLAHHGVLGMHWGQHKAEDEPIDNPSDEEKAVRDTVGANEHTSDKYREMYGPDSDKGISPDQKKLLIGAGVGAAIVGGVLLAKFGGKTLAKKAAAEAEDLAAAQASLAKDLLKMQRSPAEKLADQAVRLKAQSIAEKKAFDEFKAAQTPFEHFLTTQNTVKLKTAEGYTKKQIENLSDDVITLKKGAVLKRVSTVKETKVNPQGFFAAHSDDDVNRYKAVLPTYWKQWGYKAEEGYVVSLKAADDIKIASPKETVNTLKNILDDPLTYEISQLHPTKFKMITVSKTAKVRDFLKDAYPVQTGMYDTVALSDDDMVRQVFPMFSASWTTGAEDANPLVKKFFNEIRAKGYSAVHDLNDKGSIGDSPFRIIDGTKFSIAEYETLTKDAIAKAQELILELAHAIALLLNKENLVLDALFDAENYLAHHGVLGMHWGERHDNETTDNAGTPKKLSRRQEKKIADENVRKIVTTGKGFWVDPTSRRTAKLGEAAGALAFAGLGGLAVSLVSRDPRVRLGASAVTIALGATSLGLSAGEHHSSTSDHIKAYGSRGTQNTKNAKKEAAALQRKLNKLSVNE